MRGRHLVRADQPAHRLARLQRRPLGGRVIGLRQQPADPRRVGGAGVHAVDPDALGEVVGGHRQRQRQHRALGRGVQGALRQAGGRGDRAGVHDRGVRRRAQVGQRGAGHPDHADHVHVEHLVPLLVGVVGDGADRADPGVVDQDVDAAEAGGGLVDRRAAPTRRRVTSARKPVGTPAPRRPGRAPPPRPRGRPAAGGRQPDAGPAAGDHGRQAVQFVTHPPRVTSLLLLGVWTRRRRCGPGTARTGSRRRRWPRSSSSTRSPGRGCPARGRAGSRRTPRRSCCRGRP